MAVYSKISWKNEKSSDILRQHGAGNLLIGLGENGINCLRTIKTQLSLKSGTDAAAVRFLGVDFADACTEISGSGLVPLEDSEFFSLAYEQERDIPPEIRPEALWMCGKPPENWMPQNLTAIHGAGQFLMAAKFRKLITHIGQELQLLRCRTGGMGLNLLVFADPGGTGAGYFSDVREMLRQTVRNMEQVQIWYGLFLPEAALEKIPASMNGLRSLSVRSCYEIMSRLGRTAPDPAEQFCLISNAGGYTRTVRTAAEYVMELTGALQKPLAFFRGEPAVYRLLSGSGVSFPLEMDVSAAELFQTAASLGLIDGENRLCGPDPGKTGQLQKIIAACLELSETGNLREAGRWLEKLSETRSAFCRSCAAGRREIRGIPESFLSSPACQLLLRQVLEFTRQLLRQADAAADELRRELEESRRLRSRRREKRDMLNFFDALFTGVIVLEEGKMIYRQQDAEILREIVLSQPGTGCPFGSIPLYQGFLTYHRLNERIKAAAVREATLRCREELSGFSEPAEQLRTLLSAGRMESWLALAEKFEERRQIAEFLENLQKCLDIFCQEKRIPR